MSKLSNTVKPNEMSKQNFCEGGKIYSSKIFLLERVVLLYKSIRQEIPNDLSPFVSFLSLDNMNTQNKLVVKLSNADV